MLLEMHGSSISASSNIAKQKYHTNLHKLIATDYETCLIMGHSTHKHFLQKF